MSYARIRQLSAHEVGHTLGFSHNFAASTYNRGSVMDYPAPMVEIKNGKLNFSNAYAVGGMMRRIFSGIESSFASSVARIAARASL